MEIENERARKILDTFGQVIPVLSEMEQEKLLSFGEGMAFKAEQSIASTERPDRPA